MRKKSSTSRSKSKKNNPPLENENREQSSRQCQYSSGYSEEGLSQCTKDSITHNRYDEERNEGVEGNFNPKNLMIQKGKAKKEVRSIDDEDNLI